MMHFLALVLAGGLAVSAHTATAQMLPAPAGTVPTPVEISADVLNAELLCRPPRARLPAGEVLDLRFVNRAAQPIMFVAPKFFEASRHLESSGFVYDAGQGGFLAAPQSTIRVLLRAPAPGEYYYSCYRPGTVPTPQSSGFLIVLPPA